MKKWRVLIRTLHFVFNGNSLVTNMVAVIFGGTQMAALCMALSNVSSPVSRGDTGESHNFFGNRETIPVHSFLLCISGTGIALWQCPFLLLHNGKQIISAGSLLMNSSIFIYKLEMSGFVLV